MSSPPMSSRSSIRVRAWPGRRLLGKKSLPVTFKVMRILGTLERRYGVAFEEMLSDNGAEFAARKNPDNHPFETMLAEMQIKHRYTRPYRPQTKGLRHDKNSALKPPSRSTNYQTCTIATELGGGLLVLFGLKMRWAAIALCGFCILTVRPFTSAPIGRSQLQKNIAMASRFLALAPLGPGAWSSDGWGARAI